MGKKITPEDEARGRRLREIREALGKSQDEMASVLNAAAERLGLNIRYKYYTVSRAETGSISFEDAAVYLAIDPERKSKEPRRWDWFVFGDEREANAEPYGIREDIPEDITPEILRKVAGVPGDRGMSRASVAAGKHGRRRS